MLNSIPTTLFKSLPNRSVKVCKNYSGSILPAFALQKLYTYSTSTTFNPFEGKTEGLDKIDFINVLPSQVVSSNRTLLPQDMIGVNEQNISDSYYNQDIRQNALNWRRNIKKVRRVDLGPIGSATFENYDINWIQCHEMVLVEKGGNSQFIDESRAYDPLIPKGKDLTITFMFEIENEAIRRATLKRFGNIEHNFKLQVCKKSTGEVIYTNSCVPTEDGRTTNNGMTSAVHFFTIPFSQDQIDFLKNNTDSIQMKLSVDDERYPHTTVLSLALVKELIKEFD